MTVKFTPRFTSTALALTTFLITTGMATASQAEPRRTQPPAMTAPSAQPSAAVAGTTTRAQTASTPAPRAAGNIIEVASNARQFTTLVAAINAAGLTETLTGAGPFTVFAPTDAAFAKLPAGTVESLLMPENKAKLTAILTYHVLAGRVASSDLAGTTATPATVQGGTLTVDTSDGVKVGGAKVTTPDVAASNGTIHVIDTVLMPPN